MLYVLNGCEYCILVKCEGVGSDNLGLVFYYLYNNVKVGDSVKFYVFVGDFFYVECEWFVVLILVGVGVMFM